jgi:hypothetical protein
MNTRRFVGFLALAVLTLAFLTVASAHSDTSIETFWAKFKEAVIKGDKEGVAAMTQFPVGMPYARPR